MVDPKLIATIANLGKFVAINPIHTIPCEKLPNNLARSCIGFFQLVSKNKVALQKILMKTLYIFQQRMCILQPWKIKFNLSHLIGMKMPAQVTQKLVLDEMISSIKELV